MENNTNTEKVTKGVVSGMNIPKIDHFGSHVARCAASNEKIGVIGCRFGEAEVSNHTVIVVIFPEKDVFWFQVSVHDILRVHHLQTFQNTFHYHLYF